MKKTVVNIFYIIVGLIIIIGIAWVLYSIVQFVVDLNTDLGKAIIAGSFTLLAATAGVVLTKYYEEKNRVLFQIREKKIPLYERVIAFYMGLLNRKKAGEEITDKEMTKLMMDLTSDLIVWGSDEVINAWAKARTFNYDETEDPNKASKLLLILENLMLEIRKDLGHKNKKIDKTHAILHTFINNLDVATLDEINEES